MAATMTMQVMLMTKLTLIRLLLSIFFGGCHGGRLLF